MSVILTAGFAAVVLLSWPLSRDAPPVDSARMRIRIPFEFRLESTLLPAGEYTFEQLASGVLEIRSNTDGRKRIVSEKFVRRVSREQRVRIIFDQDGANYSLATVYWPAFPKSLHQPATPMLKSRPGLVSAHTRETAISIAWDR